jgi:uncharacterized protein with NAD-binding domain and iron-sulfur cluster
MRKRRVIIVGAGLGGLSAAWHLTRTRRNDVQVVVYEASWLPGGKAASGRAEPEPSDGSPHRVEEHGLHMLFGSYRETWHLLRECYRDLLRFDPPSRAFRRIEQAFAAQQRIVFDERNATGASLRHWTFCPARQLNPVNDDIGLISRIPARVVDASRSLSTTSSRMFGPTARSFEISRQLAETQLLARDTLPMRDWTKKLAPLCVNPRPGSLALSRPRLAVSQVLALATSARRMGELIDLGFAILDGTRQLAQQCTCRQKGRVCDCLDSLNNTDLRRWLQDQDWDERNDAIVRGFYAGLFARAGELAAGVGLRAVLRVFFDYPDALVYRMQSGMGEVVVAPLYRALRKHNVEFHFLKRLTNLEVGGDRVTTLHFEKLGDLQPGYVPYKTKQTLHGELDYFPSTPPPEARLPPPRAGELHRMHCRLPTDHGAPEVIELGREDCVILAIPPKALNRVASALKQEGAWEAFLEGATATQSRPIASAQIWWKDRGGPGQRIAGSVAAGHQLPFDVWADMSHVLSYEGVPHDAIELDYLCGCRPGDSEATQDAELQRVEAAVDEWLAKEGTYMIGRSFDKSREAARYIAASLEPSDEYVLSLPNTIAHRIHPADTGFTNLRVAGDWVKNGIDCGCVESAVVGGRMAAESIP